VEEYESLQELRKARKLTQMQVANALGMKQANVSQFEQRTDMRLSALKKRVTALGGKLELVVTFPDQKPVVLSFSEDVVKSAAT
jgi:transcriptional regulator with XRE-family HTH domain